MIEVRTLTQLELDKQLQAVQAAAALPQKRITADDFLFVACFDGTNNDRKDLAEAEDAIPTNVSGLYEMCAGLGSNVTAEYYPGPGTDRAILFSEGLPFAVTAEINRSAELAYQDFSEAAVAWLSANPGKSAEQAIDVATTGFSRGCATAVRFCQLLNERGLVTAEGTVLAAPGTISVEATVLLDPVTTGYLGNLSVPGNVNMSNFVSFQARDELRYAFKAATFGPGAAVIEFVGNHGDVGGVYVNDTSTTLQGLGALSFKAQVEFFRSAGIPLGDIPYERQYDSTDKLAIHTEGVDSRGNIIWSTYGDVGTTRLTTQVGTSPSLTSVPDFLFVAGQGAVTLKPEGVLHTLVVQDVAYSQIDFLRKNDDLVIRMPGSDRITVKDWYLQPDGQKPLKNILVGSEWWGVDETFNDAPFLLEGSAGSDILKLGGLTNSSAEFIGGLGADRLIGGSGADTFVYQKGDGNDTITLGGGSDTLSISGLGSGAVTLTQEGTSAVVQLDDGSAIRVTDFFDNNTPLRFQFADHSALAVGPAQYDTNVYELVAHDSAGVLRTEQTLVRGQGNYGTAYEPDGDVKFWYIGLDGSHSTNISHPDGSNESSGADAYGGSWDSKYAADHSGYYRFYDGRGGFAESVNYSASSGYSKYSYSSGHGYSVFDGDYYLSESFDSWSYSFSWQNDGLSYSTWTSNTGGWGVQKYDGYANYSMSVSATGAVSASAYWNNGAQFNRYALSSGGEMYTWKASSGDFAWQYTNSGDIALNYGVRLADGTQSQYVEYLYGGSQLTRYSPSEGNFTRNVLADGSIIEVKSSPSGQSEWLKWDAHGSLYYYAIGQAGSNTLKMQDTSSVYVAPSVVANPALPTTFQNLRDNFGDFLTAPAITKPVFDI